MMLWIWCDLVGLGRHWNLAVEREGVLYFPNENYEEKQEAFANYPSVNAYPPDFTPEVRCSVCKQLRPATKEWVKYKADEPICRKCWEQ